ncbi:glycosyltransferase [Salinimicrobium sediminilitoris]|uniref:glycosyltransferase n=1 Tax=Salinimicrobium sediminilitoris TaxID=2876715 RepID=UPI001E640C8D|nr:glycosyltransferase [Salinimicrobium sediminilitoris]MCC8358447.1 glycosyltransferase [Salinimicrobium sediminilitoris]
MNYNILHLIDNVTQVNFGIWNAALANSTNLAEEGINSYAAFPAANDFFYENVSLLPLRSSKDIYDYIRKNEFSPNNTIIVSHGCWRWATKTGCDLEAKGFKWIAVPHGMLEPWSLKQKALKKFIYWNLLEKRKLKKASAIRAVGAPEFKNLKNEFGPKVRLIPNGIDEPDFQAEEVEKPVQFLYMARLHHKKGIVPLVKAWLSSTLAETDNYKFVIAGPDDGELDQVQKHIVEARNIEYVGAVYGETKTQLLRESHFYLLPSYSEGFPTSVLEAMSYGLIPLISEGCNFPEAFENKVAIRLEPSAEQIRNSLESVVTFSPDRIKEEGGKARNFIINNYTNKEISRQLDYLNRSLLASVPQ